MAYIQPSSTINLHEGILNGAGTRPIFKSKQAQQAYFKRHEVYYNINCTYVRHSTGVVKVSAPVGNIARCNYISFRNANFENITFYAEIIDFEQVNTATVKIYYEIDWFQTFMFDGSLYYNNCFIERQHLLESTHNQLQTNPWLPVYEMYTDEGLSVSESMYEPIVAGDTEYHPRFGDNCILLKVAKIGDPYQTQWSSKVSEMCMRLKGACQVADYSTSYFTGIDVNGDNAGDFTDFIGAVKVPNPCDIIIFPDNKDTRKAVTELLDMLSLWNLTCQILGVWSVPRMYLTCWMYAQGKARNYMARESYGIEHPSVFTMDSEPKRGGGDFTMEINLPTFRYNNAKLLRSPYAYLFCEADGNRKEWRFEDFAYHTSGGGVALQVVATFDNAPFVSVVPVGYCRKGENNSVTANMNLAERLDITNIPQIAYTTDAYLAFLGQQYTSQLATNTVKSASLKSRQKEQKVDNSSFSSIIGGIKSAVENEGLKGLTDYASNSMQQLIGGKQGKAAVENQGGINYDSKLWKEIGDFKGGRVSGDYQSGIFGNARYAYACDEYHAGSGNVIGVYGGPTGVPSGFIIGANYLRDCIASELDFYFDYYGYTCNYNGVPRVLNYILGGEQPHFVNNQTYCKTTNMRVSHPNQTAARYIEAVFNTGCHFYRGENL